MWYKSCIKSFEPLSVWLSPVSPLRSLVPRCSWVHESQSLMSERGFETASKVWTGKDVVAIFHGLGITAATFAMLQVRLV